jgi:hypothetical protein
MVEVEPDPAGKNSTSVDVAMLVTTASRIVSSVRVVKRRPDEHTRRVALSMGFVVSGEQVSCWLGYLGSGAGVDCLWMGCRGVNRNGGGRTSVVGVRMGRWKSKRGKSPGTGFC